MPNQGLTATKRKTQKKEMIQSPSRLPPSKFYSPKTPGWVSGKNAVFETPTTPSSTVIHTKKTTGRRETLAVTKTEVSKINTAKSRRNTMAFKVPETFSPVTTRSRRSSMFSVSHRKGGVRLNIAVTPQTKTKNTVQQKPVQSPGVKTRARRSTIYQMNSSVSKTKNIDPQVISLEEKSADNVKEIKASPPKRKTRGKSKTPAKKKETAVKTPTSPSKSTKKRHLVKSPAGSSEDDSVKTLMKSEGRKTPVSKIASQKRKVEESNQEEPLIKFETPVPKKMKHEETTGSPAKSRKTPARKHKPQVKSPKVETPNKSDIEKEEEIFKTPALTPSKLKSPVNKLKTPRQPKTLAKKTKTPARQSKTPKQSKTPARQSKTPKQIKTPARQSKTPKQTKTPARQSKTPEQTKTPARQSKTPDQTKIPARQSKTPEQTKTPARQSKTPDQTKTQAKQSKTPEQTKTPARQSKTPKQSKTPARQSKMPEQTKTPASQSKTPKQSKTPARQPKTPEQTKTPARKAKSPKQSKTPAETKITSSATKRKREEGTNKDLPSPVKKTKTPSQTKLDSSPVVLLTKTPMSISEPKSSTPVVVSTLKDKITPGMKKKVSPKKKSPKSKKDTKNESKVPSLVKKSLKKSKVKLKLESVSDLVHLKKGKRKATPGRNGEMEKIDVQTLHSKSVISKEDKDLDISKLSKLADLSQENDLTLDSTSHSSTGARCIIL